MSIITLQQYETLNLTRKFARRRDSRCFKASSGGFLVSGLLLRLERLTVKNGE